MTVAVVPVVVVGAVVVDVGTDVHLAHTESARAPSSHEGEQVGRWVHRSGAADSSHRNSETVRTS